MGDLTRDFGCRALTREPPQDGLTYVELVPREEIPTLDFLQIGARADTAALRNIRIVDTQGNIRALELEDLELGVSFTADHFTFEITEDMEVIQD